jgi:predicted nucleic acid-binding protein
MKSLFIDTNVIIDLIADRKPYSKFAIQLFNAAEKNKIKLYTSSHSVATTYYLLKKSTTEKALRDILDHLMDFIQPIAIDHQILKRALNSSHADFEDAIQIIAATTIPSMLCIVTRNLKDFKNADILVLPPDQAVDLI